MNYQLLDWDTKILQIKTAKIIPEKLSIDQLKNVLQELKSQNVELVYWLTDSNDVQTQAAAQECHGILVDNKVTYWMDLKNLAQLNNDEVAVYAEEYVDSQLEMLAIEIGRRSRFGVDAKITSQQMEAVYKTWIANSVKKTVAKEILVIKQDNKIIGMVTLADKNQRGDLSLVSVDPQYRGLNLGVRLVKAAQQWCIQQGYAMSQVVTQRDNLAACKLYEKCGYKVEKIENFYHFWL